jgi:hypothetical protein
MLLTCQSYLSLLRHTDLVTQEDFSGISFPAPVTAGGDHVTASIVDIQLRDSSSPMARNNQERNWRMTRRLVALLVL